MGTLYDAAECNSFETRYLWWKINRIYITWKNCCIYSILDWIAYCKPILPFGVSWWLPPWLNTPLTRELLAGTARALIAKGQNRRKVVLIKPPTLLIFTTCASQGTPESVAEARFSYLWWFTQIVNGFLSCIGCSTNLWLALVTSHF